MPDSRLTQLTSEIVAAFVERNQLAISGLPDLIRSVHGALAGTTTEAPQAEPVARQTAAQIRKSITPDALISFEDGRPYRMLKRHLTTLGLTPQTYREKWGLPSTYPMVAPAYSAQRSEFAKASGLGSKARTGTRTKRAAS
jgi:predicted transcriptional regulator